MRTTTLTSQVQTPEGLNSSTSSLDSALCLDSASSLEPSPSSSASSSFAPRPNGREDDSAAQQQQQQDELQKQLTEKVSKLCTDMQKAEETSNNSSRTLKVPMDGSSANSISSTDSGNTIKHEEEVFDRSLSNSLTPPPKSVGSPSKRATSSSSSFQDDEVRVISRPSSAQRMTSNDVISYAPETLEKLKKLERLKQRKREESGGTSSDRVALRKQNSFPGKGQDNSPILGSVKSRSASCVPGSIPEINKEKRRGIIREESDIDVFSEATRVSPVPSHSNPPRVSPSYSPPVSFHISNSPTPDKVSTMSHSTSESKETPTDSGTQVQDAQTTESINQSSQSTNSISPSDLSPPNQSAPSTLGVNIRRKTKASSIKQRASWRKTPQIDPDAIAAILRGDIDDDLEVPLETLQETEEKPPEKLPVKSVSSGILKKMSDSDVNMEKRGSPKRVLIVQESERGYGSVPNSPSSKTTSRDNSPKKNERHNSLQSSLSLSLSTPDLSALVGTGKHSSKRAALKEDSYILRSSSNTPRSSNRNSLVGTSSLMRRFTIVGRATKKSPSHTPRTSKKSNMV